MLDDVQTLNDLTTSLTATSRVCVCVCVCVFRRGPRGAGGCGAAGGDGGGAQPRTVPAAPLQYGGDLPRAGVERGRSTGEQHHGEANRLTSEREMGLQ